MTRPAFLGAVAVWLASAAAHGIEYYESLDAARAASADGRPVVVVFGADWCGYCRKLETETLTSEAVEQVAGRFLWVKVDIDEQEELAARYRVRGVPRTIVLDDTGQTLGAQDGYLPPDRFVKFLHAVLENPQPPDAPLDELRQQLAKAVSAEERRTALTALVEYLAKPERDGRGELLASVKAAGPSAWPVLLDLMDDERLAVRAAAAQALRHATQSPLSFQPFAAPETRQRQLSEWRAWIDRSMPKPESPP